MDELIGHVSEAIGGLSDTGGTGEPEDEAATLGEQPPSLDILLRDYYAKVGASERINDGITRMGGTALAIILTVFGLLTVNKSLASAVFWLLPLVIVFLVGMLMQLVYRSVLVSYYIRDLEDRIRQVSGTTPFYFEQLTGRALYSPRTGAPAFLVLYGMYFAVIATAYVGLIVYCYHTLHVVFHLAVGLEIGYLSFYGLTTAIMIWALVFYLTGMGPLYDRWATALNTGTIPRETRTLSRLRYALLPRPFDFFVKTPITVANALLAAYLLKVPFTSIWLQLIGVVVCVELLGKQATYIWNDLLDAEADRTHHYKKRRYFATVDSTAFGRPLLAARTLCAFALATVLAAYAGFVVLPPLIAGIFVVQFLYDRYAKPIPVARLTLAAAAYAERSIAGAAVPAAIATTGHPIRVVVALTCWTVTFAVLFLAASWRAEDDYRFRMDGYNGRSWFLIYGMRIEIAANLALVPLGLWLSDLNGAVSTRSSPMLVGAGVSAVAAVWLLLTQARRAHQRVPPVSIGNKREAPARDVSAATVQGSRYALYLAIAGLFVGYHLAFPGTAPHLIILVVALPALLAAVYAYATYEELIFLDLLPNVVMFMHVLNQIIFTKKHLHDILHDLQSTPPPVATRIIPASADAPVPTPMVSPEPHRANLERPAT